MTQGTQHLLFLVSKINIYFYFWYWAANAGSPSAGKRRAHSCLLSHWQLSICSGGIPPRAQLNAWQWSHAVLPSNERKRAQRCGDAGDVRRPALLGPAAYPVQCSTAWLCPRLQARHVSNCGPCLQFLLENPSRISLSSVRVTCHLVHLILCLLTTWETL